MGIASTAWTALGSLRTYTTSKAANAIGISSVFGAKAHAAKLARRAFENVPQSLDIFPTAKRLAQSARQFAESPPVSQVQAPGFETTQPTTQGLEHEVERLHQVIQGNANQQSVFSFFLLTLSIALVIDGSNRYGLEAELKQRVNSLRAESKDNPELFAEIEFLERMASQEGKMAALWMFLSGAALMTTAYYSGEMLYTIPQGVLTTTSARTLASRFIPSGPIHQALRSLEIPLMAIAATSIVAVPAMYAQGPSDFMVPAGLGIFGVAFGMNLDQGGWRNYIFRPSMLMAGSLMTIGAFKDVGFEIMASSSMNVPALLLFIASMLLNGYLTLNEIPHFRKWYTGLKDSQS